MPKIGQAQEEGMVVEWHKRDGETVAAGDVIVTVETDKSTYELEAMDGGVLHILVAEGAEVPVGTVLARVGDAPARVLASPKAKRLAAERGLDLAGVTASSPDGVISAEDVERRRGPCLRRRPSRRRRPRPFGPESGGRRRGACRRRGRRSLTSSRWSTSTRRDRSLLAPA
jgi:pyruvate/2-oxoglutarate dehydrogenase complex dihydrolipoamide acyltransferase (E2) component